MDILLQKSVCLRSNRLAFISTNQHKLIHLKYNYINHCVHKNMLKTVRYFEPRCIMSRQHCTPMATK